MKEIETKGKKEKEGAESKNDEQDDIDSLRVHATAERTRKKDER